MSANSTCCDTAAELKEYFLDLRTELHDQVQSLSIELSSQSNQISHLRKRVHFEQKKSAKVILRNDRLKVRIVSLEKRLSQLETPQEPSSSSQEEEQEQGGDLSDIESVGVPAVVN